MCKQWALGQASDWPTIERGWDPGRFGPLTPLEFLRIGGQAETSYGVLIL